MSFRSDSIRFWQTTWVFFKRDLKTRYLDSKLGLLWVILYPLAWVGLITLIFSVAFKVESQLAPYVLLVLIGFVHWQFFAQTILKSCAVITDNPTLIQNHKFPLLALPTSAFLSKSVDYLIGWVVILFGMIYFHQPLGESSWLVLLFLLPIQFLFQFGLGLIMSTLNVFIKDVRYLLEITLQLLFYATPVIYTLNLVPDSMSRFLKINPLAVLFESYRSLLFGTQLSFGLDWVVLLSGFTFLLGLLVFYVYSVWFAENL